MFKCLKDWLKKRSLGSGAMLQTIQILEDLFSSDEVHNRYVSVRALKKMGGPTVEDFKKHIIQTVLKIVQSNNPLLALRKTLIVNIQSDCMNRLLLSEEFHDRRQVIYNLLNENSGKQEMLSSDETAASIAIWREAESVCLRLIQMSVFNDASEDDWWANYVKLNEQCVKSQYRCMLAEADGKEDLFNLEFLKASEALRLDLEQQVLKG